MNTPFDRTAHPSRHPAAPGAWPGVLNRFAVEAINQRQGTGRVRNSCHRCGATAYKKLMARSDDGVMRPSGLYQCVQCRQVFSHIHEWRDGLRQ